MKKLKFLPTLFCIVFALVCLSANATAQTTDDKNQIATISGSGSIVRWHVSASYSSLTLTVVAPDGETFRREFKAGSSPEFTLTDGEGNRLGDGQYNYELRLNNEVSADVRKELAAARAKGGADDAAAERSMRRRGLLPAQLVHSGSFTILRGSVIVAGETEPSNQRSARKTDMQKRGLVPVRSIPSQVSQLQDGAMMLATAHAVDPDPPRVSWKTNMTFPFSSPVPDQVIPDDLIVQGSLCVGFDCVNNESFGFDTIRLKENNTRIKFEDTSVGSFPTNDWQLTANDSASGGLSKFSIEDITGARVPFTVEAGATTNSIYVDSSGRVGFRTSTPVLDLHTNTSNTPAIRLEQNNSGGFTAQTWDIGANEANFFVRDVTGGSLLSFRIRPGAPSSSLDIASDGDIGIGTGSPATLFTSNKVVHISASQNPHLRITDTTNTVNTFLDAEDSQGNVGTASNHNFGIFTNNAARITVQAGGNVAIGTGTPDQKLTVFGSASKNDGSTSWLAFSDERLKNIKGKYTSGLKALMQLQPIRFEYKPDNTLGLTTDKELVGFGAQALQKVIPEAVTRNAQGYLMVKSDPILLTMLNAIKEQQKEIEQLKAQVQRLQSRTGKRVRNRRR